MAKIYLSPSDQRSNTYGYGDTTEAVQCGYIAEACRKALERSGQEVKVGHYKSMQDKCREANAWGADLYAPIHTNAFEEEEGRPEVMGTRIFAYDTKGKGWQYAQEVFKVLAPFTPGTSDNVKPHPDLYEVKTPAAPTVYTEVEFHDAPAGAKWIIENTEAIGEKLAEGYCNALGEKFVPVQSPNTGEDMVSRAEYEELREKYNTLQASADAFRTRVANAIEIFEKGKE